MATVFSATEAVPVGKPNAGGRVIVAPISGNLDEAMQLLDWYTANISSPGDRLVLVRLLIPDCPPAPAISRKSTTTSAASTANSATHRRGGSASSSAASTTSSSEDSSNDTTAICPMDDDVSMEAQMERQLEDSVKQEVRLVRRLRERNKTGAGPRSFRFIHAFGREFTDSLLSIATEQGANAILAHLSAFAADQDLARTYHLYKKAQIGIIHAPEY